MPRKMVARMIVGVLLGLLTGYAMGKALAGDAERGGNLTLKEYIADFERHKGELVSSEMPMAVAVLSGLILLLGCLGVYELLAFAVDKALAALDRRRNVNAQPGTPPPW